MKGALTAALSIVSRLGTGPDTERLAGTEPRVEVTFTGGGQERHALAALGDLVTERGNPGNERGLAHVIVYLDAAVLANGAELVDTPGTDSVYGRDTEAAAGRGGQVRPRRRGPGQRRIFSPAVGAQPRCGRRGGADPG